MNFNIFTRTYIYQPFLYLYLHMKFSVSHFIFLFFSYLFIYLYIYTLLQTSCTILIQSIDLSFLLPCLTGCLSFSLPFFALPCFLALPISLTCPCLLPSAYALFLCLFPLPSACFLALPTSVPCLLPCPAFFLALPTSVPYLQIYFFLRVHFARVH